MDPGALLTGPALIGANCRVGPQARLEPYTVLGGGCLIQERASLKRSVLWDNVYVGTGAALRGAVLGSRVRVKAGAGIYEGAVVGDDSLIRENSIIKPDVKLWPNKLVETGVTVQRSLIWGTCSPKKVFGFEGISGLVNVEITPEFAARAGAAFASINGPEARLAVSCDSYSASQMIKEAVASGMQSSGAAVLDLGACITPVHRYGVRVLNCKGGVHVKISPLTPDKVVLVFSNSLGGNISRGQERKIENALARKTFCGLKPAGSRNRLMCRSRRQVYFCHLRDLSPGLLREARFKLMLCYDQLNLEKFVRSLCRELGFTLEAYGSEEHPGYSSWRSRQEMLPSLARAVMESGAAAGALLDPNADHLIMIDERGQIIQDEMLTALLALLILKGQGGTVVVPVTAPRAIEALAERYRGRVVRTKTALQDFLEKVMEPNNQPGLAGVSGISRFFLHFDALSALARVLDYMARNRAPLSTLAGEIPSFFMDRREVPVPWESKGRVIRSLIQDPPAGRLELLDGVKVYHRDGWALVLPDPDEPVCRVFSEGSTMEIAESLTDFYIDKISKIAGAKT